MGRDQSRSRRAAGSPACAPRTRTSVLGAPPAVAPPCTTRHRPSKISSTASSVVAGGSRRPVRAGGRQRTPRREHQRLRRRMRRLRARRRIRRRPARREGCAAPAARGSAARASGAASGARASGGTDAQRLSSIAGPVDQHRDRLAVPSLQRAQARQRRARRARRRPGHKRSPSDRRPPRRAERATAAKVISSSNACAITRPVAGPPSLGLAAYLVVAVQHLLRAGRPARPPRACPAPRRRPR